MERVRMQHASHAIFKYVILLSVLIKFSDRGSVQTLLRFDRIGETMVLSARDIIFHEGEHFKVIVNEL